MSIYYFDWVFQKTSYIFFMAEHFQVSVKFHVVRSSRRKVHMQQ